MSHLLASLSRAFYLFLVHVHECLHVLSHLCAVPIEAKRGHWIPRNWSSRGVRATMQVLEAECGPLEEQPVPVPAEPSLRCPILGILYFR